MDREMYVLLFWAAALLAASLARAESNELGNGGDSYAQEFTAVGRGLVERFREHPDPRIPDLEALDLAVKSTTVVTKDKLELNGTEVDAIDHPDQNRIELSRKRWAEYDQEKKAALVLHEYLSVSRAEDSHYEISHSFQGLASPLAQRSKLDFETHFGFSRPFSRYGHLKRWGFSAGYLLDPHWELGVGYDTTIFSGFWKHSRENTYSVFGKYNFSRWGRLQPFAKLGLTYNAATAAFGRGDGMYLLWSNSGVGATGAVGATYWLTNGFGLDLSATGDKPRLDTNWFNYSLQTGLRFQF